MPTGVHLNKAITRTVYHSFDEIAEMQQSWDDFVQFCGGDIYLTYDWCCAWWQYYGKGRELQLLIYTFEGAIVGLIPLFKEVLWLGPVWIRLAKIVGSDFTMIMANPPVQPDAADDVYQDVFEFMLKEQRCDAVWLGPIGEKYDTPAQLRRALQNNPDAILLKDSIRSPYADFQLPDTFAAYVQSLSKNQRGNLRRSLRGFHDTFEITQDVILDEASAVPEFEKFVQMHTEQWRAENKLGHFGDWPSGKEFNAELVVRQARKGRLRLIRLFADGQVVSYQLCFAFGDRWYWRLPARIVGSEWLKYGLGRIGLVKEIESAITEGVHEIEAGAGHYDYKIKLGGQEHALFTFLVGRKSSFCQLRLHLFMKFSNVLHYCYYRVWFNRLAPKLPFKRRPLWKKWIRSRL